MIDGKKVRGGARALAAAVFSGITPVTAVCAATLAQWDFNASNTSPSSAVSGVAATPTAALVGGVTGPTFNAGSPNDSSTPNVGWQTTTHPAQGTGDRTAGVQFSLNTLNMTLGIFSFDWRTSNTSSKYLQLQYTTNGASWLNAATFTSTGGDSWNAGSFDFSSVSSVNDNSNFAVRMVSMFAPSSSSYTAAGTTYATTGSWRWDLVTFNGSYAPPVFTPKSLVWNTGSGTWDTNSLNKPWLDGGSASAFSQTQGVGDNVTFNNPAANSVVTVDAGGVTPNSVAIINSATLTLSGGAIGGSGGLSKSGAGRLILTNSNTFTSTQSPSNITGGVIETRNNNALGGGTVSISNATWNSTTIAQSANNLVKLTGAATFETTTDLTINNGLDGSGTLNKTGAGTLGIGGVSTNSGSVSITAGTVRMDTMAAIGGSLAQGSNVAPTISVAGATLQLNSTGTGNAKSRLSGNISLNNAVLERLQLTPDLGPDPSNGDSILTSYSPAVFSGDPTFYVDSVLSVSGSSAIRNRETRTSSASDIAGGGGTNNRLFVNMPVVINTGATLTVDAPNGTLSIRNGQPTGSLANTGVEFPGAEAASNVNDSITLKPGATLALTGLADIRIGTQSGNAAGKPMIGIGSGTTESTFKAHARAYLTDIATGGYVNSNLIVAGTGLGGLRVEAAMNAVYGDTTAASTTGLFGLNGGAGTFGSAFTILSANRYAALSGFENSPTLTPDGTAIVRGGVLTLAANDAAGATGLIDNGPADSTVIKLGLDNTATSGALIYQIDPAANAGKFANFGGLVLRKSFAANVTTQLLGNATISGGGASNTTLDQFGGTLDLNGHSLFVGSSANVYAGQVASAGTLTSATLNKSGASTYTVGTGARVQTGTTNLSSGTLGVSGSLRTTTLNFAGGTVDLNGKIVVDYGNGDPSPLAGLQSRIITGNGITSSLAVLPQNAGKTGLGYAEAQTIGVGSFDGQTIDTSTVLLRYTALGDANVDGTVDSTDFDRFVAGYGGNSGLWSSGDFNYDSKINTLDFNLLAGNFGVTISAAVPGPLLGNVVPEPASGAVLALTACVMASARNRRKA